MTTDLTIKNFKIFDKDGITINMNPVTILTGCNNSGKSSIVKALCLLKDFCQQVISDHNDGKDLRFENYKLDFHKSPNNIMGAFDLVIHQDDEKNDDSSNTFTIELIVESRFFLQNVKVSLVFGTLEWDDLNNGYLQSYTILTVDGDEIFHADYGTEGRMDFSSVKKSFLHFLYGQRAFAKWQEEANMAAMMMETPKKETGEIFEKALNNIQKELDDYAMLSVLEFQTSHCLHTWKDGNEGTAGPLLNHTMLNESFILNSPALNVFFYFPCLEQLNDYTKEDTIKLINGKIGSLENPLSTVDLRIVEVFLQSFDNSEFQTIHEYISNEENEKLFKCSSIDVFGNTKFAKPGLGLVMPEMMINEDYEVPDNATWQVVIRALNIINKLIMEDDRDYLDEDYFNGSINHIFECKLYLFLKYAIEDIFVNIMPGSFSYIGSTIINQRRLYSLEDTDDFSITIKNYFEAKKHWHSNQGTNHRLNITNKSQVTFEPGSYINKWIKQLNIGDHIDVQSYADGYGVTLRLFKDEKDERGMLLADKGYGILQIFVVLLKIETAILETLTNNELYQPDTSGLSNTIIKYLRSYNELHPATIALEEPENHLHPSMQSSLADIIVDAHKQYGINFIIESHSEYFIRKLQLHVAQQTIKNDNVSLLYVNSAQRPPYMPAITDIGIDNDGTLRNEFGQGFFDESIRLSKELFKSRPYDNEN